MNLFSRQSFPFSLRLSFLLCGLFLLSACSPSHSITLVRQFSATTWTRSLDDEPLRQTLRVPDERLSEIELILALPTGAPMLASRPLLWEIRDSRSTVLREGVLETAGYLHNSPLYLRFEHLSAGQSVELWLMGPKEAQMSLWASDHDAYANGALLNNRTSEQMDLHFMLRAQQRPVDLVALLRVVVQRWERVAPWIPLMLIAPGWLLGWLLTRNASRKPIVPFVAGLSLSLAPFVYLWTSLIGVRLYEPLVQSLFMAAGLILLWVIWRELDQVQAVWRDHSPAALAILGIVLVLGIGNWFLAGRLLLAPPGGEALSSGLLAQELVREGRLESFSDAAFQVSAPLPVAAITTTLIQMSRYPESLMLLLSGLIFGVATIPAIYALAADMTEDPWVALWLLPLAWLWNTPWNALASGDLFALYSLALLPVSVALGWRALHVEKHARPMLFLAAFPLGALMLVQGWIALAGWAIVLSIASSNDFLSRERKSILDTSIASALQIPLRALFWLLMSIFLLIPAWLNNLSLKPVVTAETGGYDWLLMIMLLAGVAKWIAHRYQSLKPIITALILLSLPLLLWWRSVPIEASDVVLTQNDIQMFTWIENNTKTDVLFLLNVTVDEEGLHPLDAGLWLPIYSKRQTILQRQIPPHLVAQAMDEGSLDDAQLRQLLRSAGVTHVYVGGTSAPLDVDDLYNQTWARLVHQSGSAYIFELLEE